MAELHVPLHFKAKTEQAVTEGMLKVQAKEGGRVKILSINWKPTEKVWVVWYYSLRIGEV